jgi:hypothetical protein
MIANRSSRAAFVCAAAVLASCAQAPRRRRPPTAKRRSPRRGRLNQRDNRVMDLALNNAKNVIDYYKAKGETVAIEVVTYGPALHICAPIRAP